MQTKFFNCSLYKYLKDFNLHSEDPSMSINEVELDPDKMVFVTAASGNHFSLARGMIHALRKYHPANQVVFYDLGISEEEVCFLNECFKVACFSKKKSNYSAMLFTLNSNLKSIHRMLKSL